MGIPQILQQMHPLLDGANIAKDWYRFLRDLWEHTGAGGANHPRYADLNISTAMMRSTLLAAPGTLLLAGLGTDPSPGLYGFGFDAAAREHLWTLITLPNDYLPGSDIVPYLRWSPVDATAGYVNWEWEWCWRNVGGDVTAVDTGFGATTTAGSSAAPGAAGRIVEQQFTALSGADKEPGSTVFVTLSRRADVAADTYAADAVLLSAGFKYVTGGVGTVNKFP